MDTKRCPICGGPLTYPMHLLDGDICGECERDLRFAYPILYLPRVGDLDDHPRCETLRRKDLQILKKTRGEKNFYGPGGKTLHSYRFDFMGLLKIEDFQALLPGADAAEDRIRLSYEDYHSVMVVDYARPLSRSVGKPGVQNIRKRHRGFCVTGTIRAGEFKEGDMVGIYHDGNVRYGDILAMDFEEGLRDPENGELRTREAEDLGDRGEQGRRICAGFQVTMVLDEKAGEVSAGDLIVMD